VAFDGTTIVSGSYDSTVRIWRVPYDKCERVIEENTELVCRVWLCTAPNEHIVVSEDRSGRVNVHDIRTGDRVCAPIECHNGKLS
jgi:WD40 repeat protein